MPETTNNTMIEYSTPAAMLRAPIDDSLVDLVELLDNIDESSSISKLNETSISDNNGSRIFF